MKVIVQDKPERFEAEQFLVDRKPWPDGVERTGRNKYHFVVNVSVVWTIKDGSWIIHRSGKTEIESDKNFKCHYDIVGTG